MGVNLSATLDLFFPPICGGCRAAGSALCAACVATAPTALRSRIPGLDVVALGAYQGPLRRAILTYKSGRRDVGDALASRLAAALGPVDDGLLLAAVPSTAARERTRGFDPGERLARRLGRELGRPVLAPLRQRAGDAQRGRSRDERLAARGRFALVAPAALAGVRFALIDDVATTGATLRDCAATLRAAGARIETAFVLARA